MVLTQKTTLVMADRALNNRNFYLIFEGNCDSFHMRAGLSFNPESSLDRYEIDVVNKLSGVADLRWQSQIVGRSFRLIIDIKELARNKFEIAIKAIGHATEDLFLIIDSGCGLMTHEEAMKLITEQSNT